MISLSLPVKSSWPLVRVLSLYVMVGRMMGGGISSVSMMKSCGLGMPSSSKLRGSISLNIALASAGVKAKTAPSWSNLRMIRPASVYLKSCAPQPGHAHDLRVFKYVVTNEKRSLGSVGKCIKDSEL